MSEELKPRSPVERYRSGFDVTWDEFQSSEHRSLLARIVWDDMGQPDDWSYTEWEKSMDAYYFDGEKFSRNA